MKQRDRTIRIVQLIQWSESPVIYLNVQHKKIYIILKLIMQNLNQSTDIWEILIEKSFESPSCYAKLQEKFEIGKLYLQKISPYEIRAKRADLSRKYDGGRREEFKSWMENEYRIFMWFCITYFEIWKREELKNQQNTSPLFQTHWTMISTIFHKQSYVCRYFYYSSEKLKPEIWTLQEDQIINRFMNSQMHRKWTNIGLQIFKITNGSRVRKAKSIRERWLNHLNPQIKRTNWTPDEELNLVEKIIEYGKRWAKIAKTVGNRSQHTIKNQFNKIYLRYKKGKNQLEIQNGDQEILEHIYRDLKKQTEKKKEHKEKEREEQKKNKQKEELIEQSNIEIKTVEENKQETEIVDIKFTYVFRPIILMYDGLLQ